MKMFRTFWLGNIIGNENSSTYIINVEFGWRTADSALFFNEVCLQLDTVPDPNLFADGT